MIANISQEMPTATQYPQTTHLTSIQQHEAGQLYDVMSDKTRIDAYENRKEISAISFVGLDNETHSGVIMSFDEEKNQFEIWYEKHPGTIKVRHSFPQDIIFKKK